MSCRSPRAPSDHTPTTLGFSQTLSETAISVPHSAAVLQAWPLCGPKLGSRNAPHGACRPIASLAPDWANARFSRCTPWCPRLVFVVRDGGWVKKERPGFPDIPGTPLWGYGRKIYRRGSLRLSRTPAPVPAIKSSCMLCTPVRRHYRMQLVGLLWTQERH